MKINVRVFGELSETTGKKHTIELQEGANVKTLTNKIGKKIGQQRQGYLGNYKVGGKELAILINGKNVELIEGLQTPLKDGDEVVLLIYTMGG
jgi:molybdopterin synthase sulfur carrier subunit